MSEVPLWYLGFRVWRRIWPRPGTSLEALISNTRTVERRKRVRVHGIGIVYRGITLSRNTPLLGSYSRTIPRVLWWS